MALGLLLATGCAAHGDDAAVPPPGCLRTTVYDYGYIEGVSDGVNPRSPVEALRHAQRTAFGDPHDAEIGAEALLPVVARTVGHSVIEAVDAGGRVVARVELAEDPSGGYLVGKFDYLSDVGC